MFIKFPIETFLDTPEFQNCGWNSSLFHQLVFNNTIVGIAFMSDRKFVWANQRMAQIFGYRPGELDGESVRRLYVTNADFEEVGHQFNLLATGAFYTHEHQQVCKDGRTIWCRVSGRLIDKERHPTASIWVVQDLTERKQVEDRLARSNAKLEQKVVQRTLKLERSNQDLRHQISRRRKMHAALRGSRQTYRALFRNVPVGLLTFNEEGSVLESNDALLACLGATNRQEMQHAVFDAGRLLLDDQNSTSLADLAQSISGRANVEIGDIRWLDLNGTWRDLTITGTTIGRRTILVVNDISERKALQRREHRQQEALAHASRLSVMGQIASELAHELGQPLTACQNYLFGIQNRIKTDRSVSADIEDALGQAADLIHQARGIVQQAREFIARRHPKAEDVDLGALVDQTLSLLKHQIRSVGARVEVTKDYGENTNRFVLTCRKVALQQVIVNLVMNALEALDASERAERRIRLEISREQPQTVTINVRNTGPALPTEIHPQLFDAFVTTKPEGIGMGLMICRTIVESHGGSIRLASSTDGDVCFRITLPEGGESA